LERDTVMRIVDPLFDLKGCVNREELLGRLDASADLTKADKRTLHQLSDGACYTRPEFEAALRGKVADAPVGYRAGRRR
jgi:hypothetical protein